MMRAALVLGLLPALSLAGCGSGEKPSPAADEIISRAEDEEERQGLIQARDDIDAEMRRQAAAKDAEIQKLRRENEALRARLDGEADGK